MSISGSSSFAVTGLISGMNTSAIVNAMLQEYMAPITQLQSQQSQINTQISDYQNLNSQLSALQTAADALTTPSSWNVLQASSTNSSAVTATAGPNATQGSLTFSVNSLAAADTLASSGTVSSTGTVIASSPYLLSTGGAQLGFTTLTSASGLSIGSHNIQVTQSSAAASTTGTTAPASSTTIGSTNNTFGVTIDGTAYTYTIASGTYNQTQLASALASASGGTLQASINSNGMMQVSTTQQGSAATLQVTGGTSLSSLGLSTMSSATSGIDGIVNVDGTSNTITNVTAGSTISLTSGSGGSISAVLGSSITAGTMSATNVGVGNGSLSSVVSAINAANTGITATAVETSSGVYKLQLASNNTGVANDLSVNTSAFSSALGNLQTITAGANAQLSIGTTNPYTVTSASNTVTNVLPGVSLNLLQTTSSPVTVNVTPNGSALASTVNTYVQAANTVLNTISKYDSYNSTTKQGGPLMGDPLVQGLTNQILSAIGTGVGTSSLSSAANAGITLNSNGTIAFNQSAFITAYNNNPTAVQNLFAQGGTFTPSSGSPASASDVSLVYANDGTQAGKYNVIVSHSATQAVDTGNVISSGTITAAETVGIKVGSSQISFAAQAGATLSSIAAGLNKGLAANNMGLSASVNSAGTQIILTSNNYGSASSYQVETTATGTGQTGLATTANTWQTFSGTDIAGSINGITATGTGQTLAAPSTDPTLAGLSLQITTPGITTSTSLGSYQYSPGIAQQLSTIANQTSNPVNGLLNSSIQSLQNQNTNIATQIANDQYVVSQEKATLTQSFANMETQLGTIKNQGSWLTNALAQLPGF